MEIPNEIQWQIDHCNSLTDALNFRTMQPKIKEEREEALIHLQQMCKTQNLPYYVARKKLTRLN